MNPVSSPIDSCEKLLAQMKELSCKEKDTKGSFTKDQDSLVQKIFECLSQAELEGYSKDEINLLLCKLERLLKNYDLKEKYKLLFDAKLLNVANKQNIKNSPLFTSSGFFNSIYTKSNPYEKLFLPLLNAISLLITCNSEDAKKLLEKWQNSLHDLSKHWIDCKEKKTIDYSYNDWKDQFNLINRIQKFLTTLASSGILTKDFLNEVLKLDTSKIDLQKPLGLNFDAIDHKIDQLNVYLEDPNCADLSIFFSKDSPAYNWPKNVQFTLVSLIARIRRYIMEAAQNHSKRSNLINSSKDFLKIFDNTWVNTIISVTGDKALDMGLYVAKSKFLKIVEPKAEIKKLEEFQSFHSKKKKQISDQLKLIEAEISRLKIEQTEIESKIEKSQNQEKMIISELIQESNRKRSISWFAGQRKDKEEIVSNISWLRNDADHLERQLVCEEKKLKEALETIDKLNKSIESIEKQIQKAREEDRVLYDKAFGSFIKEFCGDLFDSVYQLNFDTRYQEAKNRDFHLSEVFKMLSGLGETVTSLIDYLQTTDDYLINQETTLKNAIEKNKKGFDQNLDKYLSLIPSIIQHLAIVIEKNSNHQMLIKVIGEEIGPKIQREPLTSLEKQSFFEWLIGCIGEPLQKMM